MTAGVCPFPSVRAACDAVIETIQAGVPVARIELLDALQIRDVEAIRGGTLGRERFAALKRNQESPAGAFEELRRHDGSPV